MNKQKLIGMIIKKDSYKDTKPLQADIQKKKQQAVNLAILAIYQILKDDYNAQAKLYAVRFLKDCFEKGNQSFISKVQNKLLPLLVQIALDSEDNNSVLKYGGSYTKTSDLQKFKALVMSLFKISRQCIQKWASWIPDSNRGFVKAQRQVAKCKSNPWNDGFLYFRQQNQEIFKQNCKKGGVKLSQPQKPKEQTIQQHPKKPEIVQEVSKYKSVTKIRTIIRSVQERLNKKDYLSKKQIEELQSRLNASLNEYIEEVDDVDQKFLQSSMQKFEVLKRTNQKANKSENVKIDKKIQKKQQIKLQTPKPPQKQIQKQQKYKQIKKQKQNVANPTFQNIQDDKNAGKNSDISQKQKKVQKKQPFNEQPPKIQVTGPPTNKQNIKPKQQQKQIEQRVLFQPSDDEEQEEDNKKLQKQNKPAQTKLPSNNSTSQQNNTVNNTKNKNNAINNDTYDPIIKEVYNQAKNSSNSNSFSKNPSALKPPTQYKAQQTAKFIKDDQFTGKKTDNKNNFQYNKRAKQLVSAPSQSQIEKPQNKSMNSNQNSKKSNQSWNNKAQSNLSVNNFVNTYSTPDNSYNVNTSKSKVSSEIEYLTKKYEKQTKQLYNKISKLQNQVTNLKQNQQKNKAYNNTWRQFDQSKNKFLKELQKQQKNRQTNQNDNYSQKDSRVTNKSSYKVKKISPQKSNLGQLLIKQYFPDKKNTLAFEMPASTNVQLLRVDEDYVNNITNYQKIGSWLSQINQRNFKLCILGVQEKFYQNEGLIISKLDNLFTENGITFLKLTFSFQFKKIQQNIPKVVYKNIAEIDFWTKNIIGNNEVYTQQTIGRLCLLPLKIMKATINFGENLKNSITFLVPFLYINYLKTGQFDSAQFTEIIRQKQHKLSKSKVFPLNNQISHASLAALFKKSIIVDQYLQICFEQSSQRVLLTQIELLRNQKAVIRVLPIPIQDSQMNMKAKQLINNLVYLLS